MTEDGEGDPPSRDPEEWVRARCHQPDGGVAGDPVNTASGNFFEDRGRRPNVGALEQLRFGVRPTTRWTRLASLTRTQGSAACSAMAGRRGWTRH